MDSVSQKIYSGLIAMLIGVAFLPLLANFPTLSDPTIDAIFALVPIMALVGLGMSLWFKKRNSNV